MKDIQQLKEEFDKLEKADNLAMIKFYESNADTKTNRKVIKKTKCL